MAASVSGAAEGGRERWPVAQSPPHPIEKQETSIDSDACCGTTDPYARQLENRQEIPEDETRPLGIGLCRIN